MATFTTASVVANSRTPLSVVWYIANPGGGDDAPTLQIPRATVLAQLREGPLKAFLTKTANWTVLNMVTGPIGLDDRIRFTKVAGGLNASLRPPIDQTIVNFLADALELSIINFEGEVYNACGILLEMRLVHSNER